MLVGFLSRASLLMGIAIAEIHVFLCHCHLRNLPRNSEANTQTFVTKIGSKLELKMLKNTTRNIHSNPLGMRKFEVPNKRS